MIDSHNVVLDASVYNASTNEAKLLIMSNRSVQTLLCI